MSFFKLNNVGILLSYHFDRHQFASSANAANLNTNTQFETDTAFVGANVLNPSMDLPISDVTILVSQGNIVKIQPESQKIPANYSIVNIQDKWSYPA